MPPKAEDVAVMEESNAKETLQEFPRAAGAYDRMPFASAAAVWTLDTSTDIFLLHSLQVRLSYLTVRAELSTSTTSIRIPVARLAFGVL